jgi:outer membrane protein
MAGRNNKIAAIVAALAGACSVFALSATAQAADLPTMKPAPAPAPVIVEAPPTWYVRVGALGVINQSSSKLFAQPLHVVAVPGIGPVPVGGIGPQTRLVGAGGKYSNIFSVDASVGYFITPNWSIEIGTGVPIYVNLKITGAAAGAPPAGTVLSKLLLGVIPITVVYHLTQLGNFQPYVGAGIAPSFAFDVKDGFDTGGSIDPSVGLVLQTGFDYMFDRNWGVFFDAKKLFVESKGTATGINLGPPIGVIPVATSIKTNFQPWLLSAGAAYRF